MYSISPQYMAAFLQDRDCALIVLTAFPALALLFSSSVVNVQ